VSNHALDGDWGKSAQTVGPTSVFMAIKPNFEHLLHQSTAIFTLPVYTHKDFAPLQTYRVIITGIKVKYHSRWNAGGQH
jgi:hypothetical protein